MADLIARRLDPLVAEGVDEARIVFVAGARQVGKTTLIRHLTRAGGDHPMRELSLDDTATREAASADPAGFVAGLDRRSSTRSSARRTSCSSSSVRSTPTPSPGGS